MTTAADQTPADLSAPLAPVFAPGDVTEAADAPDATWTPYTVAVGHSFLGTLTYDDADAVRVRLVAGQTYTFETQGRGSGAVQDTWLTLRTADGTYITSDDDSGTGYHASITFTATTTGDYLLSVEGYYGWDTGGYTLEVDVALPPQLGQLVDQLTDRYWDYNGADRRAWDLNGGRVLTFDVGGLAPQARDMARQAFATWTATTGLLFREVASGGDFSFDDSDDGAYASSTVSGGTITSVFVNVASDWISSQGAQYGLQTFIHEIGHGLGLGHAGNYNGSADWGWDNDFSNDSWQATIMSYFDQDENPNIAGTRAFLLTPMVVDMLAIRELYGDLGTLRGGSNTYGTSTNAGGVYARAAAQLVNRPAEGIAFTIVDEGGTDTLSLAASRAPVRINLNAGQHSSAGGERDNISIALGTVIELAVGSAFADTIIGNEVGNGLRGGAGADTIFGGAGNDTLAGETGADRLVGGAGNDVYLLNDRDAVVEAFGGGTDQIQASFTITLDANVENALLVGSAAINATGNALNNALVGNAGANWLAGNAGNDTLRGGAGADNLMGGAGDDTYLNDGVDRIIEAANAGNDMVQGYATMTLGANIERGQLLGTAAANLVGNALANVLYGNAGVNRLNGGEGADLLAGGGGNDIYFAGAGDRVVEAAGGGYDVVYSTSAFTLGTATERLVLTGTAISGAGSEDANRLDGNALGNLLDGRGGNDTLMGGAGADVFVFGAGVDVILDFADNVDTIRIALAICGGAGATIASVMERCTITDTGALFTLDGGARLGVLGVTDKQVLYDDLQLA